MAKAATQNEEVKTPKKKKKSKKKKKAQAPAQQEMTEQTQNETPESAQKTEESPAKETEAEKAKLENQDSLGKYRLSCQCTVDHDMHVKVLMPFSESGLDDPGSRPKDHMTP